MDRARLDQVPDLIRRQRPDVFAVYVFGSVARGDDNESSDIDLAVLTYKPFDPVERWKMQEDLAAFLGKNVDLVDLAGASTVARVQVIKDGIVLFDGEPNARALFEATALSQYTRLQVERRGILEDIRRRGHVLG